MSGRGCQRLPREIGCTPKLPYILRSSSYSRDPYTRASKQSIIVAPFDCDAFVDDDGIRETYPSCLFSTYMFSYLEHFSNNNEIWFTIIYIYVFYFVKIILFWAVFFDKKKKGEGGKYKLKITIRIIK